MEGKGLVLDCWRGRPSSGESWMVQAASLLQLLTPDISLEVEVFWTSEKFVLFIHSTCLGSNTPEYWEVRTGCHQLRYRGGCLHPPCMLQQAAHDSEYLGCALLGTSKRNPRVLPAAFVPHLLPRSWAVSLAAVWARTNPPFVLPRPLLNT